MINQVWLKTFCTLSDVGHFTKTADKLFITQSGVSQHIKKLEQQLGMAFSLTNAGIQLYQQGNILLKASEELENLIKHDEQYEGNIKISSPGSVGLKLYPYLLEIQQAYPKLIVDYTFAPNKTIERGVTEQEIDVGLLTKLSGESSLVSQKIAVEPLVLVTSSDVKLITWEKLLELGFISHPDAAHHGSLLLGYNFSAFEHVEQFVHKGFSNQISLILEPVSKGLGFTVMPLSGAKAFHQQKLINIHSLEHTATESLYICFNRHSIQTNRFKFIKKAISDYLETNV